MKKEEKAEKVAFRNAQKLKIQEDNAIQNRQFRADIIQERSIVIKYIESFLESTYTTIFMTAVTLYALFGDDIRVLTTDADGDPTFWIFNTIAMCLFFLEIILASVSKKGYFWNFFFFLDLISTLSLLLDIGWVASAFFGSGGVSGAKSALALARAGRASRVGTRAGRIVRIVRLVRLVKLYKHGQEILEKEAEKILENEENNQSPQQDVINDDNGRSPSNLLKRNQSNNNLINNPQSYPKNEVSKQQNPSQDGKPNKHSKSIEQMISTTKKDQQDSIEAQNQGEKSGEKAGAGMPIGQENLISEGQNHNTLGKKGQKLPPINLSKDYEQGPSKPQILDKYKNDPLIYGGSQQQNNTEERDKILQSKEMSKDREGRSMEALKRSQTYQRHLKQQSQMSQQQENQTNIEIPQETKLGQRLSDLTTRRVITLVLSIMVSIPIFSIDTYQTSVTSYDTGLLLVYHWQLINMPGFLNQSFSSYINYHKDIREPVVKVEFTQTTFDECCKIYPPLNDTLGLPNTDNMRTEDQNILTIAYDGLELGYAISYLNKTNSLNAILSILRTIFVSFVLGGASMLFSKDVEDIVLQPVENMLNKVKRISENPLAAAQMEESEAFVLDDLMKQGNDKLFRQKQEEEKMETSILEKLIIKIGALLALGFGEAGSQIIAENMKNGGNVNPLIPGQKIIAIFGFIIINNFLDTTEVLQKDIMLYVNEIAEVTHGIVNEFCGQTNKNIGEAFLLVWKFQKEDYQKNEALNQIELKKEIRTSELADLPVCCFIKCIGQLAVSKKLQLYSHHPGLNAIIQNFTVKLGFGLHIGWGIEGAIGSMYKIDASYLSPNVNMAARLEAATKQFGVQLLISGVLYNYLTPKTKVQLRKIDTVTVKGSIQPMDLYTCDLAIDNLKSQVSAYDKFSFTDLQPSKKKKIRVLNRLKRDKRKTEVEQGIFHISSIFEKDREVVIMRSIFTKEFYFLWEQGFQFYKEGKWAEALTFFEKTKTLIPGHIDGPSKTLGNVIKNNQIKAPSTWKGFRPLTEK